MDRNSFRRASALAIAVVVGLGTGLMTAGPAAAGAGRRVAAGTYTATFPATASSLTLAVTNAVGSTTSGSWAMNNNDAGTWVVQGTTVAFEVSYSEVGHDDELLIGKLTTTGISPGALMVPSQAPQPWSALRIEAPASAAARAANALEGPKAAASAAGPYSAQFPGFADTLTLTKSAIAKKSGTFTLTTLADSGNWLILGKKMVLSVSLGLDEGVLLLGTTGTNTISTAAAPGVYYQPTHGTFPWYATRIG